MSDDPADVPIRSAATVMLLDDRPDLHVLMLKRRAASVFVGGMSVFPGGGVDPEDAAPDVDALTPGLSDAEASKRLGLEQGGLAYWVAAIRECFEEAGVLLAHDPGTGAMVDFSDAATAARFDVHRKAVDASERRLAEIVGEEKLEMDVGKMHYAARWITPKGPPRRYDTRFFVSAMPAGQTPLHDDGEAVDHEWVRPADALARFEAGELLMLPPTVGMLRIVGAYERSVDAVAAAARTEDGPDLRARLSSSGKPPAVAGAPGAGQATDWKLLLPGDDGYDTGGDFPLEAWIRFRAPA